MSDGLSDANALGRLAGDLEEALYNLRDVLRRVNDGQRGITISVKAIAEPILRGTGYKLLVDWDGFDG